MGGTSEIVSSVPILSRRISLQLSHSHCMKNGPETGKVKGLQYCLRLLRGRYVGLAKKDCARLL